MGPTSQSGRSNKGKFPHLRTLNGMMPQVLLGMHGTILPDSPPLKLNSTMTKISILNVTSNSPLATHMTEEEIM